MALDPPLRGRSWGRAGEGLEVGQICPQTPGTAAPKSPHPEALPASGPFPRDPGPPRQTLPQAFAPVLPALGLLPPVRPPGLAEPQPPMFATCQACCGNLPSACLILTLPLRVRQHYLTHLTGRKLRHQEGKTPAFTWTDGVICAPGISLGMWHTTSALVQGSAQPPWIQGDPGKMHAWTRKSWTSGPISLLRACFLSGTAGTVSGRMDSVML